jgi:hypothetical protein
VLLVDEPRRERLFQCRQGGRRSVRKLADICKSPGRVVGGGGHKKIARVSATSMSAALDAPAELEP